MPLLPASALAGPRRAPLQSCDGVSAFFPNFEDSEENSGFLIREGAHCREDTSFVTGDTFSLAYTVGRKIGAGAFGRVYVAQHNVLGLPRAVKCLQKSHGRHELRRNELTALLALDHPHIVHMVEYFEEDDHVYLVFELCEGPDLLQRIQDEPGGRLSQYDASLALRHMLKALQCCHSHHWGHYDIKPENFMYVTNALDELKMIDLGMSSGFDRRRKGGISGTAAYMAPEFWRGIYGPEGDVWSCGMVLFMMLTGEQLLLHVPPEIMKRERKTRALLQEQLADAVKTHCISEPAQDLLQMMLQHDRHARPTVREALKHPFSQASYESEAADPERQHQTVFKDAMALLDRLPDILRAVAAEPMLKRVARLVMAQIGDSTASERLAFRMLDSHGYAEISIAVLENHFLDRGLDVPEDVEEVFEAMDLNRDGYISYTSFMMAALPKSRRSDERFCRVTFSVLDPNKDGYIDAADLASVFGHPPDSDVCKDILEGVCPDGKLSSEAFVQLMRED